MSNEAFVLLIAYMSLCVGTFISLKDSQANFVTITFMSVLLPIPVFVVLIWAAISVARDTSFDRSRVTNYFLLFVMSIANYSEAVAILRPTPNISKNPVYITTYEQKIRTFSFTVKRGIATSIMSA